MDVWVTVGLLELITASVALVSVVITAFLVVYREVKIVHRTINSRMDELLETTRQVAHTAGVQEGRNEDIPGP